MPINPAIAMGVQPIQLADPLSQYGKVAAIQQAQNQNALAQYQLGAAQREELAQNALSEAYKAAYNPQTGAYDINKLRGAVISAGAGARLPDIEKKMAELKTQQLAQSKAEGDLIGQRLELAKKGLDTVRTPEEYVAWHESNHRDPILGPYLASRGITPEASRASIVEKLKQPGGFQQLLMGSALGLEKTAEQHFAEQNTGGTVRTLAMSKYSLPGMPSAAVVVPGSEAQKTLTPGELLTAATARRGQDITAATTRRGQDIQQALAFKPQFNAQAGGYVVPPTAGNPQGGFIPLPQVQATKEQESAAKALKSAGYDPATGSDRIEELIKKSTSGIAGAGVDAIASFFGKTTEGRKAIGALGARANQIALDLAGGKLGAGISNTDRDFLVTSLGDVANPMKSAGERLAAWKEAKSRMLTSGLVQPPKPSEAGGAATNVDALLEKYK